MGKPNTPESEDAFLTMEGMVNTAAAPIEVIGKLTTPIAQKYTSLSKGVRGASETMKDVVLLVALISYSGYDALIKTIDTKKEFLYTDLLPIRTANLVSSLMGQGMWLPHKNIVIDPNNQISMADGVLEEGLYRQ